jgi:hypothetical protein
METYEIMYQRLMHAATSSPQLNTKSDRTNVEGVLGCRSCCSCTSGDIPSRGMCTWSLIVVSTRAQPSTPVPCRELGVNVKRAGAAALLNMVCRSRGVQRQMAGLLDLVTNCYTQFLPACGDYTTQLDLMEALYRCAKHATDPDELMDNCISIQEVGSQHKLTQLHTCGKSHCVCTSLQSAL